MKAAQLGSEVSQPVPLAQTGRAGRIDSVDLIRGVVMVLMAIDHVRVYAGVPAGGPTPGVFFTRWVTHFCAPAFVFLAGTGAFLHGRKLADRVALARYLVTRGLLLVALELTVIRSSWTFAVGGYADFTLAGVIWMLGWCMVLLAALVWLPAPTVGWIGLAIVSLQQLFAFIPRALPDSVRSSFGFLWEFVYPSGLDSLPGVSVLYSLVPWIGVMAAGYGFGTVLLRDDASRRRFCLRVGVTATALFVLIAGALVLFGPAPDEAAPAWLRILNQNKYPASQLFLMMTLGPTLALLPLAERARGRLAGVFVTFGRVPMFYYLLHIPLIHATALLVGLIREGAVHPEWYATAPYAQVPQESRWSLPLLYFVFAVDVAILYPLCRWLAGLKSRSRSRWLRYV